MTRRIAIFGAGGHARETRLLLEQCGLGDRLAGFYVDAEYWSETKVDGLELHPASAFDPDQQDAVIAVGDSAIRQRIAEALPPSTHFPIYIHPSALVPAETILRPGCMIHAGCIVTTNVSLGHHVLLNRATNIGHDCRLADFVTTSPGVVVSGNCSLGEAAYLGASACIRERVSIGAYSVVGMGSVVVRSIPDHGVYVGNPARPISDPQK